MGRRGCGHRRRLVGVAVVVVVQHAGRPVYDLPTGAVVVGVLAALASIVGWGLVARSGDPLFLGGAVLGLLLVGGVAALLSVGVLLLLAALALATVIGRAAGRRRAEGRHQSTRLAILAAALVGLGLPIAAGVAADGPRVRCLRDGVATSSSIFRGGSSVSGGSGESIAEPLDAGPAEHRGSFGSGGRTYAYRCVGTELVEFRAFDT